MILALSYVRENACNLSPEAFIIAVGMAVLQTMHLWQQHCLQELSLCAKGFNAGLPDCSRAKQPARRNKAAAAAKQASAEPSLQPPTAKRYCVPPKSAFLPSQA